MKKIFYLSVCILLLSFHFSCDNFLDCITPEGEIQTRTIELDDINAFDIFGACELTIKEGAEQQVEITAHPNIIEALLEDSSVKEGTWDLGIEQCISSWKKSNLKIDVTIPALKRISITGSADVTTDGVFENIDELSLNIEGSGDVDLQLGDDIETIETKILGSGDVTLSGKTENSTINIDGSGNINHFDLSTKNSEVNILGSGNCNITATELLDIKIAGSGDLCFKGNPVINSRITGSGELNDCN